MNYKKRTAHHASARQNTHRRTSRTIVSVFVVVVFYAPYYRYSKNNCGRKKKETGTKIEDGALRKWRQREATQGRRFTHAPKPTGKKVHRRLSPLEKRDFISFMSSDKLTRCRVALSRYVLKLLEDAKTFPAI